MNSSGTASRAETILVVDDNAPNRLLAEAILRSAGYGVLLAEGGPQALQLVEGQKPDLVLLDLLMPGMDGFETLDRLRRLPGGATLPVVFLTALNDFASVQRAIASGADDFLVKPINRTELLVRIWSLLGAKRARPDMPAVGAQTSDVARVERDERDDEKARARDELTALVVHDLKHPLTTIYFNAGVLRRDPNLSPKALEKVNRILRASETLESMIASILDVARSETGELPLDASEFELAPLLDEVVTAMGPQAEHNRQRIELSQVGAPRVLRADRDLLRRTLENLVDNSIKYAPPDTSLRLEVTHVGETVEFRVRDAGPGIPAEERGRVFEKFAQLERDAARRGRRSRGLGLVFVRVAAHAHGGKAWVEENAGGKGSCICVRIPVEATTR